MAYNVDATYFEKIDTPEKAYWLGFIHADGCVRNNVLIVQLGEKDLQQLKTLANDLGYNGPIKYKLPRKDRYSTKGCYRLEICSTKLCKSLKLHGLGPRKKNLMPIISDEFVSHFFRGYFDADGSIYNSKSMCKREDKKYEYYYLTISTCGSGELLEKLKQELEKNGVNSNYKDSKSEDMKYVVVYGGNNQRNMYAFLYKDATRFLDRKAIKWKQLYSPFGSRGSLTPG